MALALTGCDPSSLDGFDLPRPAGTGGNSGSDASVESGGTDAGPAPPPRDAGTPRDATAVDSGNEHCPRRPLDASDDVTVTARERPERQVRPSIVKFRDGAASGRLADGTVLWLYHQTNFNDFAADGAAHRISTAATGTVRDPVDVSEPVDAKNAPAAFFELTAAERAPAGDAGSAFLIFWPNTVVLDRDGPLVFYAKNALLGGGEYDFLGSGVARPRASDPTRADRDEGLLFDATRGDYAFHAGGVVWKAAGVNHLYLYGCARGRSSALPCRVARAPEGQWTSRSGYRFWDGAGWSADVNDAVDVFPDAPLEPTVSYNRYLQRFIAVYTVGLAFDVWMRTAPRPEGPWSGPISLFKIAPTEPVLVYGAKEHPELSPDCGKTLVVTYPQHLPGAANEIRVVDVTLE